MPSDILERLSHWFALHGASSYEGNRRESVSALNHALQCAQLAEDAHADAALVAAALLHDIGHFVALDDLDDMEHVDDLHELRGVAVLVLDFPAAVIEPIRLHVAAKRYLTAIEPKYLGGLSPASVHSLAQQGGPFRGAEIARFEALPFAQDAVRQRRWDDLAKRPGWQTPSLAYYLALADEVRGPVRQMQRGIEAGERRRSTHRRSLLPRSRSRRCLTFGRSGSERLLPTHCCQRTNRFDAAIRGRLPQKARDRSYARRRSHRPGWPLWYAIAGLAESSRSRMSEDVADLGRSRRSCSDSRHGLRSTRPRILCTSSSRSPRCISV